MTPLHATGWTLVHFLWQGAIVVAAFAALDAALRHSSARIRYAVATSAMLVMLLCAATTFLVVGGLSNAPEQVTTPVAIGKLTAPSTAARMPYVQQSLPLSYLPWLVYVWMAGVLMLSTRMLLQWIRVESLRRRGIRLLDEFWQERVDRIADRLQLSRTVRAYESAFADVPSVIGWLRPVVLMPTSALLQLSPSMIEALLAHELAHVRRHDYLVNLMQSCIETLFFYHPGVWWVGRRMREERENCCDDLAVAVCGNAIVYARALADLEQSRRRIPELAMAANGGSLLTRIQRLIGREAETRPLAPVGATSLTFILAAVLVWAAPQGSLQGQGGIQSPASVKMAYQAPTPSSPSQPAKPAASKPTTVRSAESYLDQIAQAGYRNATPDQLIAMKIHGVTPAYIAEMRSLGWSPTIDQLIAFRVHGVEAATVNELRGLGMTLTPDQAVAVRVHGITSAYATGWKQQGLKGLDLDSLVALRVHGADPSHMGELKALGFSDLSADDIVGLRVSGVTPDFIREAQKYGFKDLRLEQIMQLKRLGILGSKQVN